MSDIIYQFSTHLSPWAGYHKAGFHPTITIFLITLWNDMIMNLEDVVSLNEDELLDEFVEGIVGIILLERICLERAFQHIKMKNRCRPICKLHTIAKHMINLQKREIQ